MNDSDLVAYCYEGERKLFHKLEEREFEMEIQLPSSSSFGWGESLSIPPIHSPPFCGHFCRNRRSQTLEDFLAYNSIIYELVPTWISNLSTVSSTSRLFSPFIVYEMVSGHKNY